MPATPTPKVFVTKFQPDWDFSPATEYGEVVFVTDEEHRPEPCTVEYNRHVTSTIILGMDGYMPEYDYIVLTASALVNMVVAFRVSRMPGLHNILRWNNKHKRYDLYKLEV